MSWILVGEVAKKRVGGQARRLLLLSMADRANDDGTGIYASFQTLADMCECSRATVKRLVKEFLDEGLIRHVGMRGMANGIQTNDYSIVLEAVAALANLSDGAGITKNPVHGEPGASRKREAAHRVHHDPGTRFTMTPKPIHQPIPLVSNETKGVVPLIPNPPPKTRPSRAGRNAYTDDFQVFWTAWPAVRRERSDKAKAFERWNAATQHWPAEIIWRAAARYTAQPDTRKENFKYCCLAEVFLNGKLEAAIEAVTDAIPKRTQKVWSSAKQQYVEREI